MSKLHFKWKGSSCLPMLSVKQRDDSALPFGEESRIKGTGEGRNREEEG